MAVQTDLSAPLIPRRAVLAVGAAVAGGVAFGLAAADPARAASRPVVSALDHGVDPTGVKDSGDGFRRAIAAAAGKGGIVELRAGNYRVRASGAATFIELPAGVAIRGDGRGSRPMIRLESDDQSGYRELFRVTGSGVTIDRLQIVRSGSFPAVLINAPTGGSLNITRSVVDGRLASFSGFYCHGLQLGLANSTQKGVSIDRSVFRDLTSCILITNACTATLRDVRVTRSRMQSVDFNCPNADAADFEVSGNVIDGTGSTSFGVSLAHVRNVSIRDNLIRDVPSEAIHIEDYSSRVVVERNRFMNDSSSGKDASAYIQIIGGSNRIVVRDNRFVGRSGAPSQSTFFVAAMPGGSGRTVGGRAVIGPSVIRVHHNVFDTAGDAGIDAIYLQGVRMARIQSNTVIGTGSGSSRSFSGSARAGVVVRGTFGADLLFSGNTFRGWRYAIDALGPAKGRFRANTVTGCRAMRSAGSSSIAVSGMLTPL